MFQTYNRSFEKIPLVATFHEKRSVSYTNRQKIKKSKNINQKDKKKEKTPKLNQTARYTHVRIKQ